MAHERIKSITIEGLRTIKSLKLPLGGVTVLIGENGTGKSSIIEALEILRRTTERDFFRRFIDVHGGLGFLGSGSRAMHLGVDVCADPPARDAHYEISFREPPFQWDEAFDEVVDSTVVCDASLPEQSERESLRVTMPIGLGPRGSTAVHAAGAHAVESVSRRVHDALSNIEVHVGFEVTSNWVAASRGRRSPARDSKRPVQPERLDIDGSNLTDVYQHLLNESSDDLREDVLEFVRLGLGPRISGVFTKVDAGGFVALWVRGRGDVTFPVAGLSDGELAWLAFVALLKFPRPSRSLLAFDEPELHLHPSLLQRVVRELERLARSVPVVLATHSDRLLDFLEDPAASVRICDFDDERGTIVKSLDRDALQAWLADYRGVGHLRAEGYLPHVTDSDRR